MTNSPPPPRPPLATVVELTIELKADREALRRHDKSLVAVCWLLIGTATCIVTVVVVATLVRQQVEWYMPAVAGVIQIGALALLRFHRETTREQREMARMQIYLANLVESANLLLDAVPHQNAEKLAAALEEERKRLGVVLVGSTESARPFLVKASGNVQQNGAAVEFDSRSPSK